MLPAEEPAKIMTFGLDEYEAMAAKGRDVRERPATPGRLKKGGTGPFLQYGLAHDDDRPRRRA